MPSRLTIEEVFGTPGRNLQPDPREPRLLTPQAPDDQNVRVRSQSVSTFLFNTSVKLPTYEEEVANVLQDELDREARAPPADGKAHSGSLLSDTTLEALGKLVDARPDEGPLTLGTLGLMRADASEKEIRERKAQILRDQHLIKKDVETQQPFMDEQVYDQIMHLKGQDEESKEKINAARKQYAEKLMDGVIDEELADDIRALKVQAVGSDKRSKGVCDDEQTKLVR